MIPRSISRPAGRCLFLNPRRSTLETPEVVQLGPAHGATTNDLQGINQWGMDRENSLDSYAGGDSPHRKVGCRTLAILQTDYHALKGLHPLPVPLPDAEIYSNRVSRSKGADFRVGLCFNQRWGFHKYRLP